MPSDLFAFLQYEFQGVGIAAETAVDSGGFVEEGFEQDEEAGAEGRMKDVTIVTVVTFITIPGWLEIFCGEFGEFIAFDGSNADPNRAFAAVIEIYRGIFGLMGLLVNLHQLFASAE